jgi:16S rRNA (cytosine967-C5)-methyltransferase
VSPARKIAFRVLQSVHGGGYATDLLRRESPDHEHDARDLALAESIVLGCLRYQSQLDYLIEFFSGRKQPKLDDVVRIALRMGIFQLRYLDRIPPHAAVTESVELVKQAHKRSAAGFVNAVLRKVNRSPIAWPDKATELSLPAWMLERWQRLYGNDPAMAAARAALEQPEAAINPDTGRQQDPGAQSIVPLLEIQPGMTVLDLCAAPGNKTAQALALGANVIAADRYIKRLAEVPAAAQRVVLDAATTLPFNTKFDRILVDAPCSGTGTLARNPEIKWRLRPSDLARFADLQRKILENALPHLKPGGKLVYSTCSLEREENEEVIVGLPVTATHLRLPGRDPGDGFFAAVIIKDTVHG